MKKVHQVVFSVLLVVIPSFNLFSQPVTVETETGLIAGTSGPKIQEGGVSAGLANLALTGPISGDTMLPTE